MTKCTEAEMAVLRVLREDMGLLAVNVALLAGLSVGEGHASAATSASNRLRRLQEAGLVAPEPEKDRGAKLWRRTAAGTAVVGEGEQ